MTLTPAYGRDYRSAKAVKADFDANKDFLLVEIHGGDNLINKEQIVEDMKYQGFINIRYNRLRNVAVIDTRG